MANVGGNHDGTVTVGDFPPLGDIPEQHHHDAGVEGGGSLTPAAYYGPGFVTPGIGNGQIEQAIVPPSTMVAAVNAHMADQGLANANIPEHPRGRSIHERLGPRGNGFHHHPALSGFQTPPELPHGASYGHAPTAPHFPLGATPAATFVPTTGWMTPGPPVTGGSPPRVLTLFRLFKVLLTLFRPALPLVFRRYPKNSCRI